MSELRNIARGVPGPVWRRIIPIPPSTGSAAVTVKVQGKRAWEIQSVSGLFTASATAGNRLPTVSLIDADGGALWSVQIAAAIVASTSRSVSWSAGLGAANTGAGSVTSLPLPTSAFALPGEALVIGGNTDAADTITAGRLVVIETYTGDEIHESNAEQQIVDHWHALYELYEQRRV